MQKKWVSNWYYHDQDGNNHKSEEKRLFTED